MASAGFSSYSTTPSTSMEQLNISAGVVDCASSNAINKMQTIADMLLLQSDDASITVQPIFSTDDTFKKCKDAIIRNAKGLAATIRQMNHQLRQRQYGTLCKSLEVLADQVITVTEATAQMAYTNPVDSITPSDRQPSFNRYLLVKCELDITAACERLQFEYGSISSEELLKTMSGISDHVASIKRICLEAKDLEMLPSEEKIQISLLSDSISAAFVSFVNCLKILMSNPHSSEYRQKCLILSKPLLTSIATLRQITDTTIFSYMPVVLQKKPSDPMTALLGSAMAIVSSSVRYVESVQSVAEDMDDTSSWKLLVNCSKSVAESATLMATSLKESTPFASRRSSFSKADL